MNYAKYFMFSLISLWLFGFWYILRNNNNNNKSDQIDERSIEGDYLKIDNDKLLIRLKQLEAEIKNLETKNSHNERVIKDLQKNAKKILEKQNSLLSSIDNSNIEFPNRNFEELRRKIFSDVKDVSFYMNSQLNKFSNLVTGANNKIELEEAKGRFRSRVNLILAQLYNLSTIDLLGKWREDESTKLGLRVQKKIYDLQNPADCEKSRKIICDLNKACGFGCQMHHVMYCFITSYFTGRTMILESNQWRYNPQGYNAYFKPISENCVTYSENPAAWNEMNWESEKTVKMPIIDVITNKPKFFPLSIPKEFENELKSFHGDPFIWWAGQILSYLMRFNSQFEKTVKETEQKLGFQRPCVGVHVRRTDKVGTEAAFHSLEEYMAEVEDYFTVRDFIYSNSNISKQRVVYLASDEIAVLTEAKTKYPNYKFVFDESNAKSASVNQRYSPESAQGVILDIYFLSQCDYLVCTFSSQVCRMAYELMQTRFPDASWRFRSLDDVYYFGGQNGHVVEAIMDHIPNKQNGEIELRKGDEVGLAGNHWNGFSKGRNYRTNEEGLFPSYKAKDIIQVY